MAERCQVCGARWRKDALKCHECGALKRNTILPEEPAGAPIDAAASLATGPTPQAIPFSTEPAEPPESVAMPAAGSSAVMQSAGSSTAMPMVGEATVMPAAGSAVAMQSAGSSAAMQAAASSSAIPGFDPARDSAAAAAAAQPLAVARPAPVPAAVSEPLPRPGGGQVVLLAVLVALVLIGGGVGAYFAFGRSESPPESERDMTPISISARGTEPPGCAELEALAGSWVFATATTNARNEARVGMRGFFELEIVVKNCSAEATLTKVGRKGKPTFADHKSPRATAVLTPGVGLYAFGFGGHFDLKNEDNQGVPLRITFAREGDQLVGAWRQVGARWESSGMYGVLVGEREGDPRKIRVRRQEQPCAIQCAAPEDLAEVEQPDTARIEACLSACR